ncbi:hypothetical protein VB779_21660 [Haloarculaceae archaeon H-GB11]|nr:hypothetical protein [Haloarculaceae archaeon H-GB11]
MQSVRAVFETTLGTFQEQYDAVQTEWLADSGYERQPGSEFGRYGADFEPEDRSESDTASVCKLLSWLLA